MTSDDTIHVHDVESLARMIGDLTKATGQERDALTLWPARLHLARNADDCIELFVEGTLESFARAAIGRGLEAGQYRDSKEGRAFHAIVIRSGSGTTWERPMAHLAYEALQALCRNADATNEELLAAVSPYLGLVLDKHLLSPEQQLGLTGELIFLLDLLNAASALGVSSRVALECWTGWESASRDFKGGGVAIEVKTTGATTRHHWIHPMYQLLPEQGNQEKVFACSIGLRVDRSRDFKLTIAISRVLASLPSESHDVFKKRLEKYAGTGFAFADWRQYELEPGYLVTLPPTLFRVDLLRDLLRRESFVGGQPPSRVADIRYLANLDGLPVVGQVERQEVFSELLIQAAGARQE